MVSFFPTSRSQAAGRQAARWRALATACLVSSLAGCGLDPEALQALTSGSSTTAPVLCQHDPRVDASPTQLSKVGKQGLFTFVLVQADPTQPTLGTNSWTLRLLDARGASVYDATLTAVPSLLDATAGANTAPQVTSRSDQYTVSPIRFTQRGLWQVALSAQVGMLRDQVVFTYCVDS
jgi:hypothetical protein